MQRIDLIIGEGDTEIAIAHRLLDLAGIDRTGATSLSKGGQAAFWREIARYIQAARKGLNVFALADLEQELCAGALITKKIAADRPNSFCLRLAVRMSEAWLLADTEGVSKWLRISSAIVPTNPDVLPHAKRTLVDLARRSPNSRLSKALVPQTGLSGVVGAEYLPLLQEFISNKWSPMRAASRSDSLMRALRALGVSTR